MLTQRLILIAPLLTTLNGAGLAHSNLGTANLTPRPEELHGQPRLSPQLGTSRAIPSAPQEEDALACEAIRRAKGAGHNAALLNDWRHFPEGWPVGCISPDSR